MRLLGFLATVFITSTIPIFGANTIFGISTRAGIGAGDSVLISGFILSGTGTSKLLIRARAPVTADNTTIPGAINDVALDLYSSGKVASNDNWEAAANKSEIDTANRALGSPLLAGSKDAALLISLTPGIYSAVAYGINGSTGVGILEVYSVDPSSSCRISAISSRGFIDSSGEPMIAGVITTGKRRVLFQTVGKSMAVDNSLPDPKLTLYNNVLGIQLDQNDSWDVTSESKYRILSVRNLGGTPLQNNSGEAAILTNTGDGQSAISAIAESSAKGGSGVAMIEAYDVTEADSVKQGIVLIGSSSFAQETGADFTGTHNLALSSSVGPVSNALALSGARTDFIANLAVGGSGIDELEREFSIAKASNPECIIATAFSNDLTSGLTAAQLWPRFQRLIQQCVDNRIILIGRITQSRTDMTAAQRAELVTLRNLMLSAAATTAGFFVDDAWAISIDTSTGGPKADYVSDGIHFNNLGAFMEGRELAKLFKALWPDRQWPTLTVLNASGRTEYLPNTSFSGTAGTRGTATLGTVPSQWYIQRYSGTGSLTCSTIANSDGTYKLRVSATGCSQGDIFQIRPISTGTPINGKVQAGVKCTVVDGTAFATIRLSVASQMYVFQRDPTATNRKALGLSGDTFSLLSPAVTISETTATQIERSIWLYAGGPGSFIVDLEAPTIHSEL